MYSENGILVDFDEIKKLIDNAEVFAIGFANFPERLLVDARSNERETALVQVVEPAASAQERLAWLQRRRPSLSVPQTFTFVAWPHSPSLLVESGVWERVLKRVAASLDSRVEVQCGLALKQLTNLDSEAIFALLKGENCITLWPPQPRDDD